MTDIVIGVGDLGATADPGRGVRTYALGSCVAIILKDPAAKTVGMVHVALPESAINAQKAAEKPGYFADTGLPALLKIMAALGCDPKGRGLHAYMAGGANVMDPNNLFNIGKRNALATKKLLWQMGIPLKAEDTGGTISRTVSVYTGTGIIRLSSPGKPDWNLGG